MQKEKWKRLKEDRRYLISSWGRIFSLDSSIFIRPYIHKSRSNNYLRVGLRENKKHMVHILVANNFQAKELKEIYSMNLLSSTSIQVNHKDRNTLNPNNNNLEWTTESENKLHMFQTSTVRFGGKTYKGKLG